MRLDIVIPAHNEEARIGRMLAAYRPACPDPDVRFLVAMDDCRDRTAARSSPSTATTTAAWSASPTPSSARAA